jgi:hypothetical protein
MRTLVSISDTINLALGTIATAKPNVVVRIRGQIIQIRTKRTRIARIIPIATANHRAVNHNSTHSYTE